MSGWQWILAFCLGKAQVHYVFSQNVLNQMIYVFLGCLTHD